MQTRDNDKKQTEEENIRDLGLVGSLLIAEYQVDKLRTRLANLVNGYR